MAMPKNMPPLTGARERFHEASKIALEKNIEREKEKCVRQLELINAYLDEFLERNDMEAMEACTIALDLFTKKLKDLSKFPTSEGKEALRVERGADEESLELTDEDLEAA